jgi:hypothetical protein
MMPEDISSGDWLTREVFARFGLAIYESQVLEHGIVNLVVWSGLRDRRYRTYEETETDNAELFRQTLGSVKTILVSRRPDIGHLDDLLIRAVRLPQLPGAPVLPPAGGGVHDRGWSEPDDRGTGQGDRLLRGGGRQD